MHVPQKRQRGFTLVELIAVIIVAGFLGVVLVNLLGTQLLKSATPVASARDAAQAEATMEVVVAYYNQTMNNNPIGTLQNVADHFPNNATFSATRNNNFNNVDALIVTVTEGGASLTNVLTQERTDTADNVTNF